MDNDQWFFILHSKILDRFEKQETFIAVYPIDNLFTAWNG